MSRMMALPRLVCPSLPLCPHHTLARGLATSPMARVHREVTEARDFPTTGIAINTRVKKLNFPPFMKDLFCGVFNKSVLSYAEVLNYGRHYNLEQKVKDLGGYLEGKREALGQVDGTGRLPPEVLHAFRQSGMFGLSIPTEYGGADFLATEIARIYEVLGSELSLAEFMNYQEFLGGSQVILTRGTEEQKAKYLGPLTSGELLGALCLAEESCGSDPSSTATTATFDEEEECYVLNGTKTWVVGGGEAGLFTVFAKLCMKNYLGEEDRLTSAFLVERGAGGVQVAESRRMAGMGGIQLADVTFNNTKVPKSALLGDEGKGLEVLASFVHHNKFMMAAGIITHLRGLLDATVSWCNERRQFGLHLAEFTLVRHQLAQCAARLYCLEAMVYLTAGLHDVSEVPDVEMESVLVRLYAAETSQFITSTCLHLLGMRAAMEDSQYQKYLRDNQAIQQWQGTNNILKCFVGITGVMQLAQAEMELEGVRQPMGGSANMGRFFKYSWDTRLHRRDQFPLRHKLAACVHPRLVKSAEKVEWGVHKLHWAARELLLSKGGNLQVEEKYLERLSDISMEVFASVCALSRASRSYVVGHTHAQHEIDLVIPYIFESRLRVRENVWKCVGHQEDQGNRDDFWISAGSYMAQRGSYCPVHPLTKNSF